MKNLGLENQPEYYVKVFVGLYNTKEMSILQLTDCILDPKWRS